MLVSKGSSWLDGRFLGCLEGFHLRSFRVLLGCQLLDNRQRGLGCVLGFVSRGQTRSF